MSGERKQAKLQWVQDPSQRNVDNLNNVRREASRQFRNKKKAYLKAKIEDLQTNIYGSILLNYSSNNDWLKKFVANVKTHFIFNNFFPRKSCRL